MAGSVRFIRQAPQALPEPPTSALHAGFRVIEMKRVLIVDDESVLLQAMQRQLKPMGLDWEMVFAESGYAAIEAISSQSQPFDVVVTDMKMPGMDGAAVLQEVARVSPHTVRIALSGQPDPRQFRGVRGLMHQFLTKPCAAADLVATVERTCATEWASTNAALGKLLDCVERVPAMTPIGKELLGMVKDSNRSVEAMDEAVARYPQVISKIGEIVNSSFFGKGRMIADPREGLGHIGSDSVVGLMAVHAFLEFSDSGMGDFPLERHRDHSTAVAARARAIAQFEGVDRRTADETVLAALLHDAGQLVLAANFPDRFAEAVQIARAESLPMHETERRVFGVNHADIASHQLALWAVPSGIVAAVSLHHAPTAPSDFMLTPLLIVHFADAIENERMTVFDEVSPGMRENLLEDSPWEGRVDEWRKLETVFKPASA